jgi:hypothetical protein
MLMNGFVPSGSHGQRSLLPRGRAQGRFPSREGQGPSGPGVGSGLEATIHPGWAARPLSLTPATPPEEGIFKGLFAPQRLGGEFFYISG